MFYQIKAKHKLLTKFTCKVTTKHYLFGILLFIFESIEDEKNN